MSTSELVRHTVAGFVFLSALSFLLMHNSTTFDETEGRTLAQMSVVVVATIFVLWASMRRLRARWYATALGISLILFALTCAHELVGRLWVSTASLPGETWQETFARHKEKAHALVEINVHR